MKFLIGFDVALSLNYACIGTLLSWYIRVNAKEFFFVNKEEKIFIEIDLLIVGRSFPFREKEKTWHDILLHILFDKVHRDWITLEFMVDVYSKIGSQIKLIFMYYFFIFFSTVKLRLYFQDTQNSLYFFITRKSIIERSVLF